jgi:hypothetical protein
MSDNEQKKQDLSRQVINKIVNDPVFREQLSTNPKEALMNSGFWDSYVELYGDTEAEVSGYVASFSDYCCITVLY